MEQLITGLYAQFVLRDFLGRIVPGSLFLFFVSLAFVAPSETQVWFANAPFQYWAIMAGLGWVAATGLQWFVGQIEWFHSHPKPAPDSTPEMRQRDRALRSQQSLESLVRFSRVATDSERMRMERFTVITHACSTTCLALIAGVALCVLASLPDDRNRARVLGYWPHMMWLVPSVIVLANASVEERRRRGYFRDAVIAAGKAKPASTDESTGKGSTF